MKKILVCTPIKRDMQRDGMLIILILVVGFSTSTAYIFADTFTSLSITPGTATFVNDLIFDRTDNDNSIVQGTDSFTAGKGIVYQKQGGGAMSSYTVNSQSMAMIGGPVRINNDLIFDRTDNDNSFVQSSAAFTAGKGIVFQKQGGGAMSSFTVNSQSITLKGGGDICIGSC